MDLKRHHLQRMQISKVKRWWVTGGKEFNENAERPLHSKTQGICMENSQRGGRTWTSNSSTQSLGKSYSSAHIYMDIEIFKTRTQRTVGALQGVINARRGRKMD